MSKTSMAETTLAARRVAPRSLIGAALCLGSWAAFSLQDAIVKSLVVDLPVPEVLFGRSAVIVSLSIAFLGRADYAALAVPKNLRQIALRSGLILIAWVAYYRASRSLQLAELVTYYFVAPLFVVALSAPLLKERVGIGRWLATLLGFGGVLVAASPGGGAALAPVGLALLAAFSWALTTILARSLAKGISTPAMMMAGSIGFLGACGAMLPGIGVWPNFKQALAMGALGLVGGLGQYLWFEGVRYAEASLLATLEYSMVAYAIFWGYVVFGDWPHARTFVGAAIVLTSGLLVISLELRRRRVDAAVYGAPPLP
jgi:S-adenosylmethionine uptake transporter